MTREFHERPGLYCIELRTARWSQCLEWYRTVLGLRVLVRVVEDGYALLDAGETRLALLARDQPGEPSARISFAFEIHDLPNVLARIEQHGQEYTIPPGHPEELREVNLSDPDGNRVRLFCWPKNH